MIEIREVESSSDLKRFIDFPYRLYHDDPWWVPPLKREVKELLTTHPFHLHAESRYFLALKNGEAAGRVAAILNHRYNEFHGVAAGFFGFFECENDREVARALLARAVETLKERGATEILGPASPSSNGEFGLLIDGFDLHPAILMPYQKPYYRELIEEAGFEKAKDLYAYVVDEEHLNRKTLELFERISSRLGNLKVREVDLSRFREEIELVIRLYNSAWERNWGFVPMTEEELRFEARQLRRIIDSRVVLFAEAEGETVAFALSLPDINLALKHARGRLFPFGLFKILYHARKIRKLRTILLGVVKEYRDKGLDGVLYWETIKRGLAAGYNVSECSWILEDNMKMRRAIEKMGGRITQTYRVFSLKP